MPAHHNRLISGGADASIRLWDLTSLEPNYPAAGRHVPLITSPRGKHSHTHGVTCVSFYPFDSGAVLSSSYDHSLKVSSTHTLSPTASFPLGSIIYAHAMSPIAQHVLIACATQASVVRLVDLRSGAMTQGLIGHRGDVLNASWSPRREHILATAGADGTVRLWDIRRSAAAIGMLDLEDDIGLVTREGQRSSGVAHIGPCNGVTWTTDGEHIISAGHDDRIRVWHAATGRNTLVHFGPTIRNKTFTALHMVAINVDGRDILIWPNEKEIMMGEVLEGKILRRFQPGRRAAIAQGGGGGGGGAGGTRNTKEQVTGVAWRGAGYCEFYSAHTDGLIRAWLPGGEVEADLEDEAEGQVVDGEDENFKKRKALEQLHRHMTKQRITFT